MNTRDESFSQTRRYLCEILHEQPDASPKEVFAFLQNQHAMVLDEKLSSSSGFGLFVPREKDIYQRALYALEAASGESRAELVGRLRAFLACFPECMDAVSPPPNILTELDYLPFFVLNDAETNACIDRYMSMMELYGSNDMEKRLCAVNTLNELIPVLPPAQYDRIEAALERGCCDSYWRVGDASGEAFRKLASFRGSASRHTQLDRVIQKSRESLDEDNKTGVARMLGNLADALDKNGFYICIEKLLEIISGYGPSLARQRALVAIENFASEIDDIFFQQRIILTVMRNMEKARSYEAEITNKTFGKIVRTFDSVIVLDASQEIINNFLNSENSDKRLQSTKLISCLGKILGKDLLKNIIQKLSLQCKEESLMVEGHFSNMIDLGFRMRGLSAETLGQMSAAMPEEMRADVIDIIIDAIYHEKEIKCDYQGHDQVYLAHAEALGHMVEEKIVPVEKQSSVMHALITLLSCHDYSVRLAAWKGICSMPRDILIAHRQYLEETVLYNFPNDRLKDLGKILVYFSEEGQSRAFKCLQRCITSGGYNKEAAIFVMSSLDSNIPQELTESMAKMLMENLDSDKWQTVNTAAEALGVLAHTLNRSAQLEVLDKLKQIWEHEKDRRYYGSGYVRISLMMALANACTGLPEEMSAVAELLTESFLDNDFDVYIRQAAINAFTVLVQEADEGARPALCHNFLLQILSMDITHQNIEGMASLLNLCLDNLTDNDRRAFLFGKFVNKLYELEAAGAENQGRWLRQILFLVSAHCHLQFTGARAICESAPELPNNIAKLIMQF